MFRYVPPSFKFRVMLFADFEEVAILLHSFRAAVGETSRARRMNKPDPDRGGYIHAGRSYFVDDLLSSNAFWVEWFLYVPAYFPPANFYVAKKSLTEPEPEKRPPRCFKIFFHASPLGPISLEKRGAILLLFDPSVQNRYNFATESSISLFLIKRTYRKFLQIITIINYILADDLRLITIGPRRLKMR